MDNKWMIMFAGIGTVFAALMGLIVMLTFSRMIFGTRVEKKRPELAPLPEINSPTIQASPAVPVGNPTLAGGELVAAITAAIASASGIAPSAFRITSMSASSESDGGFNTPVWGRRERFARK